MIKETAMQDAMEDAKSMLGSLAKLATRETDLLNEITALKNVLRKHEDEKVAMLKHIDMLTDDKDAVFNKLDIEIRKNEKLRLGLSQFVNLMEQAQPVNEVPKPTEEKKGYVPNTATQPPFYGIHIENGEAIIYPPERCQTLHQLSQFYRLAGLVISHDKLMERPGVHLRGLSNKHRARLNQHYDLKFPDGPKEPERPFVRDLAPHYINSGQSATHGPMKREDGW